MFYLPHGLTVDHEGNLWLTDIGMQQVFMFKQNNITQPALTIGELFQNGQKPGQFCRPTDVAVMKNGDFFVADGLNIIVERKSQDKSLFFFYSYCNTRIVKFNRKGNYIMEWGSPMNEQRGSKLFIL